jgi:hypothetical protein
MRRRLDRHVHIAPFGIGLPGFLLFSRARGQRSTRNGADTGQRFAAKAEANNGFQIVKRGNFTGGMTRQRQRQLVFLMPQPLSRMRISFAPPRSISISMRVAPASKAVFHQLFHHRRRTFHHLTGGDLVLRR